MTLATRIASALLALENCRSSGNEAWEERHEEALRTLVSRLPRGGGIDVGPTLSEESTPNRLIFTLSFHHMNENGFYDGWTDHTVTVTPSLALGFEVDVTGPNENGVLDYLGDVFADALHDEVASPYNPS